MVEVIRKIFSRLSEATFLGVGLLVGSFFDSSHLLPVWYGNIERRHTACSH